MRMAEVPTHTERSPRVMRLRGVTASVPGSPASVNSETPSRPLWGRGHEHAAGAMHAHPGCVLLRWRGALSPHAQLTRVLTLSPGLSPLPLCPAFNLRQPGQLVRPVLLVTRLCREREAVRCGRPLTGPHCWLSGTARTSVLRPAPESAPRPRGLHRLRRPVRRCRRGEGARSGGGGGALRVCRCAQVSQLSCGPVALFGLRLTWCDTPGRSCTARCARTTCVTRRSTRPWWWPSSSSCASTHLALSLLPPHRRR